MTEYEPGTIRIKAKNLLAYQKTKNSWRKIKYPTENIKNILDLFKAHNNIKKIIDTKDPKFIKGYLTKDKQIKGQRIDILPNNKKLNGTYSIFSKNLIVHDQNTSSHWDVLYKNPKSFAHLYTLEKIEAKKAKKYSNVKKFAKLFPKLEQKILIALLDKKDFMATPMYTLIKTYMRVGNEMYYKLNGHKGLTTLKNKDVTIKSNTVEFNYIGKDAVPIKIKQSFPDIYIKRLKELKKKNKDFIFTSCSGNILKDTHFKRAFKKYIGEEFYPHIVRSFFATTQVENFLKTHKTATKEQTKDLLTSIAEKLGHKKFNKKKNTWEDSYTVTIHSYINPNLVKKLKEITKN